MFEEGGPAGGRCSLHVFLRTMKSARGQIWPTHGCNSFIQAALWLSPLVQCSTGKLNDKHICVTKLSQRVLGGCGGTGVC